MKDYRKVLLGMILLFSLWNAGLYLQMILSAWNNNGIWIISFDVYGEMIAEVIMWSVQIILILIFIITGVFDRENRKI